MIFVIYLSMGLGCVFILLAAIGSVKFPDTLTRMAAVCKASTLGSLFFCMAGILHFRDGIVAAMLIAAALVLFLGIPIASHLLARVRMRSWGDVPLLARRNDYAEDFKTN